MSDNKSIITPFCEFLEEDHSQNPSPLIGLIKKLKKLYHKTKADLSLNFSSYPHHVDDEYLDYFINELHSYYQIQEVDLSDTEEWLNKYNLKVDDIEKYKYPKLIKYFFELPYEPQNYKGDSSDIHNIRKALILYFKDKYTKEMLDFLESKKKSTQIENGTAKHFTSEEVVYAIIENHKNLKALNEKIANEFQSSGDFSEDNYTEIQFRYDLDQNAISWSIQKLLDKLYLQSNKDNYYFFDCPLKAYLANIDRKIKDYQKLHIDANMIDFYKTEINYLLNPEDNRLLYSHNKKDVVNYNYFCNDFSNFEITLNKKIEYITNELVGLGVETTIEENYIGRDSDQLIKTPVFKKINRPYTPEKVKIIIPATQEKIINITKPPSSKKSDYNTKIFRNKKAEEWFLLALDELNAIDENKKAKSGFQSRVSAIFYNDQCKKEIFRYHLKLNEFISFLNSNFNANITSDKKLSSGINHVDKVQDIVKQYVARKPE